MTAPRTNVNTMESVLTALILSSVRVLMDIPEPIVLLPPVRVLHRLNVVTVVVKRRKHNVAQQWSR